MTDCVLIFILIHNLRNTIHSFRSDINLLRALAVTAVVFCHALAGAKLGYLGVDVFFVLSGFLMAATYERNKHHNTSLFLIRFLASRSRRIVPSLALLIVSTTIICIAFYTPYEIKNYFEALKYISVFLANVYFSSKQGYFDASAELVPLLHLWSISVEEQFYLLFGLIGSTSIILRVNVKFIFSLVLVAAIIILSFTIDEKSMHYSLSFRMIEFAFGFYCYQLHDQMSNHRSIVSDCTGVVSFLTLLWILFIAESFTSLYLFTTDVLIVRICLSLFVSLLTVLILISNSKFLSDVSDSSRLIKYIGLASYTIYLWHQPLLATSRILGLETNAYNLILILLIYLLSGLIWRFYESKFLKTEVSSKWFYVLIMFCTIVYGFSTFFYDSYLSKLNTSQVQKWVSLGQRLEDIGDVCEYKISSKYSRLLTCEFGAKNAKRRVALYGDSHSQAIQYALDDYFKRNDITGIRVKIIPCNNIIPRIFNDNDPEFKDPNNCLSSQTDLYKFVKNEVSSVIVIARWTFKLYPVDGFIDELSFDNNEGGKEFNPDRKYFAINSNNRYTTDGESKSYAIDDFFENLNKTGKRVILIYPIPETGWDIHKYISDPKNFGKYDLSTSRDLYNKRNKFIINIFDELDHSNICRVFPADALCNSSRCNLFNNYKQLYLDDDHLSDEGAELLLPQIESCLS